jgi:uncharacterized membrane protein required for colicin V production
MHNPIHSFFSRLTFNYFDFFVIVWLIVGVLRGRKNGMSQELLPTLKWIAIVVLAGLYYGLLAGVLQQNVGLDSVQANVVSYVVLALVIHLIFSALKSAAGEKLVSGNLFGGWEYYFGMVSGCIRFGCIVIVLLALIHARIITKAEMAETAKIQKQNFEDISFPTPGSIQQALLFQSFTGQQVQAHLASVLITSASTDTSKKKPDSIGKRQQNAIDEVLGPQKEAPK